MRILLLRPPAPTELPALIDEVVVIVPLFGGMPPRLFGAETLITPSVEFTRLAEGAMSGIVLT